MARRRKWLLPPVVVGLNQTVPSGRTSALKRHPLIFVMSVLASKVPKASLPEVRSSVLRMGA